MSLESNEKWPMFIPTRYPFTYAYDLLRSHRSLDITDTSRGGVSVYLTEVAAELKVDKTELCNTLADIYVGYEMALEEAAKVRDAAIEAAMSNTKPALVSEADRLAHAMQQLVYEYRKSDLDYHPDHPIAKAVALLRGR